MTSARNRFLVASVLLIPLLISVAWAADVKSRVSEATRGFRDVTLTANVLYTSLPELRKIDKDISKTYEFQTTTIYYKAPDKMKIEGKLGLVKVALTMNDHYKAISIPSLHYSKKEDITGKPHKRQTDFDIGILSDSLWKDYVVSDVDTVKDGSNEIYRITFERANSKKKRSVAYVDTDSLKLLKLESYANDGDLKSRSLYSNHTKVDGIWVPQRVDLYSPSGKLAASTAYENIKVNTGLPDSLFKI